MPWSKFSWSDWSRDPNLRISSHAAKGLWMDMLCQMDSSRERGYLLVSGRAATIPEIAKMVGSDRRAVERLIAELEANGVLSRDDRGAIFCRRMTRESAAAQRNAANGKLGGNPSLKTNNELTENSVGMSDKAEAEGDSDRESERKKGSEAKASASPAGVADAPAQPDLGIGVPAVPDVRTQLWTEGVPALVALIGKSDGAVRRYLGHCLKALNDDCARLLVIIREALVLRPADPAAWISAAAKKPPDAAISAAQHRRDIFGLPSFLTVVGGSDAKVVSQ